MLILDAIVLNYITYFVSSEIKRPWLVNALRSICTDVKSKKHYHCWHETYQAYYSDKLLFSQKINDKHILLSF